METVHLFVTSRKDPLPDLDSLEDIMSILDWFEVVRSHALKFRSFEGVENAIIDELEGLEILECYAVVFYPPGMMAEADNFATSNIRDFFKAHQTKLTWRLQKTGRSQNTPGWQNFTYSLMANDKLKNKDFEVFIEAIVKV